MVSKKENKPELNTKKELDPIQELTELLKRTQANFENYRKQQEKRIEEIRLLANKDLILQILPVFDNFELALKNCKSDSKEFVSGIELIYSQLFTILGDNGVKVIGTENQAFDPKLHEALMKVESTKPENSIVEELQKGFILNDQVVRHAKVKVSAGKKEADSENNNHNGGFENGK